MSKTSIQIPHNWRPRESQMPMWNYLANGGKRAIIIAHRRFGKDDVALHYTATAAMQRPAMYWHMLPEAAQARKAIWDAVNPHTGIRRIDEAFPKEIRATTRDQEMYIKFINGSVWQVLGSDNYDSLIGSPPAGVVFSEWAVAHPDSWAYLRPILAENGGWALFITTPRGENHCHRMYKYALRSDNDWFAQKLTVDDTNVFDKATLEAEKAEMISQYGRARGEALFAQEYYCSFKEAFTGKAVYPEFSNKYHVSPDPLLPYAQQGAVKQGIIRGWDNTGLSPACIVTYINSVGQWYLVKEFIGEDIGMAEFAEEVQMWCAQAFPAETKYRDIGDPAGKYRDSRKGSPKQYIYESTGILIEDGIQNFSARREAVAGRLRKHYDGDPALIVCAEGCPQTIKGFDGGYRYPEIGHTGYFKPVPEKNEYSHCVSGDTQIRTLFGSKPIRNIKVGDYVDTPLGFKQVSATMSSVRPVLTLTVDSGETLTCSGDHPIYTDKKVVLADGLRYANRITIKNSQEDFLWTKHLNIQSKSSTESSFIKRVRATIKRITSSTVRFTCIGTFGSFIKGIYQKVMSSTILTVIGRIIALKTWNLNPQNIMPATIAINGLPLTHAPSMTQSQKQEKPLKRGINPPREDNGTKNTAKKFGKNKRKAFSSAQCAEKNTMRINSKENEVFVHKIANRKPGGSLALIMKLANVLIAGKRFLLTSINRQKPAPALVKVHYERSPCRVYDLTVEDAHCFYANNILVSNCHDAVQYPASIIFPAKPVKKETTQRPRHTKRGRSAVTGY